MKLIGTKAFFLGLAIASTSAAACSSNHASPGGEGSNEQSTGRVSATLSLPGGVTVTSVSWTVNGPGGYSLPGTANTGDTSLEFVAGGIPGGGGYTINITATDSAGDLCAGTSSTFSITPGTVSTTTVTLTCHRPNDASVAADSGKGSVAVDAGFVIITDPATQCPGIDSFAISPAEEPVGSFSQLTLATIGPVPAILWTQAGVGSGHFSDATAASPTFTCDTVGLVTVTVTVGLPGGNTACAGFPFTSYHSDINCEPGTVVTPPSDAGPAFDGNDGNTFDGNDGNTGPTIDPIQAACNAHIADPANHDLNGNLSATCTPTELVLWKKDPTGAGLDCSFQTGCLDVNLFGTVIDNVECADFVGTAGGGAGTGTSQCLDVLNCDLGVVPANAPAPAAGTTNFAFCGAGVPTSTCTGAGLCGTQIRAGFPAGTAVGTILSTFVNPSTPAGLANAIVSCSSACSTLF